MVAVVKFWNDAPVKSNVAELGVVLLLTFELAKIGSGLLTISEPKVSTLLRSTIVVL